MTIEENDATAGVLASRSVLWASCQASNLGDDFTGSLPVAGNAADGFPLSVLFGVVF